jgi:hypothetical protein
MTATNDHPCQYRHEHYELNFSEYDFFHDLLVIRFSAG